MVTAALRKHVPLATRHARRAFGATAGIVDQAFVSLANFGLGVLVARLVSAEDFGAFSVAFAVYLVALNVARTLGTQPLLIRYTADATVDYRSAAADATGTVVVLGVLSGVVSIALALLFGGVVGSALMAIAVVLPSLLLQDAWRFTLFGDRRPGPAVVNDVALVVTLVVLVFVVQRAGLASVPVLILAWGAGATAAAAAGSAQTGVLPRPSAFGPWLRTHRDISIGFLSSELTQMASSQLVVFVIGAVAGLAALGSLRGAQLLFGPFNVISLGISLVALPHATRLLGSPSRFRRFALIISVALGAGATAWTVLILLLPDAAGRSLLGASWDGAHLVLLPVAISMAAPLVTGGQRVALRAVAAATRTFRASAEQAVAMVVLGLVGAVLAGGVGAAWGLAAGGVISILLWTLEYQFGIRAAFRARAAVAVPPSQSA